MISHDHVKKLKKIYHLSSVLLINNIDNKS
jgi:hypothetical protein